MPENNTEEEIDSLLAQNANQYKCFCVELTDEQSITVLINGEIGWLMYLREPGNAGFSTINPNHPESRTMIEFVLDNGQEDEYPLRWTYSIAQIRAALIEFIKTQKIPSCVCWFDNSL